MADSRLNVGLTCENCAEVQGRCSETLAGVVHWSACLLESSTEAALAPEIN